MAIAAALILAIVQVPTDRKLDELEKAASARQAIQNWVERAASIERTNAAVKRMIVKDELRTGKQFGRASQLVEAPSDWYEDRRVKYELALTALALGATEARKLVAREWDGLMVSTGRRPRIGAVQIEGSSRWTLEPTVESVLSVYKNPDLKPEGIDSKELQEIRKQDQAARQADFTKMTMEQIHAMASGDAVRRSRVIELLSSRSVATGRDFEAAALVLQHGEQFSDYALAHELSVCAVLRGYNDALWLVSRSYDRMLMSAGYRQRFLTQYGGSGLQPFDDKDTNDRMRSALKTLGKAQAIDRGKQIAKGGLR